MSAIIPYEINGTTAPIIIALTGVTKPAPGVIATKPATAPVAKPKAVGFFTTTHSNKIHTKPATAAAMCVVTSADAASPPEVKAEPALKPNQPNHTSPAPRSTIGRLCGLVSSE